MKKISLTCSHDQWSALHEAVEGTRKGSKTVRIEKDALVAILRDHGKLISLHKHELDGVL